MNVLFTVYISFIVVLQMTTTTINSIKLNTPPLFMHASLHYLQLYWCHYEIIRENKTIAEEYYREQNFKCSWPLENAIL